eukprot:gene351-47_t
MKVEQDVLEQEASLYRRLAESEGGILDLIDARKDRPEGVTDFRDRVMEGAPATKFLISQLLNALDDMGRTSPIFNNLSDLAVLLLTQFYVNLTGCFPDGAPAGRRALSSDAASQVRGSFRVARSERGKGHERVGCVAAVWSLPKGKKARDAQKKIREALRLADDFDAKGK